MRKAHLQVTGPEGASGIQTADLKLEVQELGGEAGKRKILGIEDVVAQRLVNTSIRGE
jgi:hypothetical protein